MTSIQYRVVVAKGDERAEGPDDADIVVTVPVADATAVAAGDVDPAVLFMQGKLKSTGPTGPLLAGLRDGSVQAALSRLASPS